MDRVVAAATDQQIAKRAAGDRVIAGTSVDIGRGTRIGRDGVVAIVRDQRLEALVREGDRVGAAGGQNAGV
jgi:hypothetical protein